MLTFKPTWQQALDRLCDRVLRIREAVGEAWPYHCDPGEGKWDTTEDGDWCGGHWVECLRIVGELTYDRTLQDDSEQRTERLRPYLERDDMFRGHRFYYSAARQWAWTRDPKFRTLAIAAAWAVRSMGMPINGAMPVGTQVQVRSLSAPSNEAVPIGTQVQVRSPRIFGREMVCVDNVHPNLILDWWAFKETGDPAFTAGARRHLDLTARDFIRPDGSTIEFIDYDPESGHAMRHYTLLGTSDESCWSRGQAWAIAGFLRAYEALGDERYLSIGRRLLGYWLHHSNADCIPPWDFDATEDGLKSERPLLDTSAAAIIAEQLARLALMSNLRATAVATANLVEPFIDGLLKHLTPVDAQDAKAPGILLDGCFNQPRRYATRTELIWGTAYLLFALYYLKTGRVIE